MATVTARGFTVIELMLFLGITGALFAALMMGINTNVTQQRYRDSVVSYSSLLQNQYSEVLNTRNDRNNNWKCSDDGRVAEQPNSGDLRGRSRCVILGRAIWLTNNGTGYQTAAVVGAGDDQPEETSDIEALKSYKPSLSEAFASSSGTFDWDAKLVTTQNQPSNASFLILRSPINGLLKIFASNSPLPSDLATVITASAATTVVKNCVQGDRGLLPIQSVSVDPRVAGSGGVVLNEDDETCA